MLDQAQEKSMLRSLETNFAKGNGDKKEEQHTKVDEPMSPFFRD